MIRQILFLILFFLSLQLQAQTIHYNGYWGIERINQDDYFILNFKPEFHYSLLHLKLNLPVEVNSNWMLNKNHWDNVKEDVITKIEYLSVTNNNYNIKLSELNNITLGNGELIYYYSDNLFNPLVLKRGLSSSLSYHDFSMNIIADDAMEYNIFFINFNYNKNRLKTGFIYGLDYPSSVNQINLFINYTLWQKKYFNLDLQNDIVKNLHKGFLVATGINFKYKQSLSFSQKFRFFQKSSEGSPTFNKFYTLKEMNAEVIQNAFGLFSQIEYNFLDIIRFTVGINKTERFLSDSVFMVRTGEKFFSLIFLSFEIFNRYNEKWYDLFLERGKNSYFLFQSGVPLSKNLSLKLDYLKSYQAINSQIQGLHQVLFYTEFLF